MYHSRRLGGYERTYQYDYLKDNHFYRTQELEMKTEQLNVLGLMDPFVGKYFSIDYIRQEVLGMTEKQIEEMDMQMTDDIEMVEQSTQLI
ncbi:MAG: hypothetical protein CM15mV22_1250 [Eurybiavirus sp.]|nr:MAG: hypothetical protein CM15mV22_1250 [Eurybiavirus sp.]